MAGIVDTSRLSWPARSPARTQQRNEAGLRSTVPSSIRRGRERGFPDCTQSRAFHSGPIAECAILPVGRADRFPLSRTAKWDVGRASTYSRRVGLRLVTPKVNTIEIF